MDDFDLLLQFNSMPCFAMVKKQFWMFYYQNWQKKKVWKAEVFKNIVCKCAKFLEM